MRPRIPRPATPLLIRKLAIHQQATPLHILRLGIRQLATLRPILKLDILRLATLRPILKLGILRLATHLKDTDMGPMTIQGIRGTSSRLRTRPRMTTEQEIRAT